MSVDLSKHLSGNLVLKSLNHKSKTSHDSVKVGVGEGSYTRMAEP